MSPALRRRSHSIQYISSAHLLPLQPFLTVYFFISFVSLLPHYPLPHAFAATVSSFASQFSSSRSSVRLHTPRGRLLFHCNIFTASKQAAFDSIHSLQARLALCLQNRRAVRGISSHPDYQRFEYIVLAPSHALGVATLHNSDSIRIFCNARSFVHFRSSR